MKKKVKKYIKRHKDWQSYAKMMLKQGKKPTKFKDYKEPKKEAVYFKHIKRKSPETRLKEAGIDWDRDKPTAKLKRKKK